MICVSGTFNGTGAALYVSIGFIPDRVVVRSVEDTDAAEARWSRNSRSKEQIDGILTHTAAGLVAVLYTAGTGIQPYEGGDLLTLTNQTSTDNGNGVYLSKDDKDYRGVDILAGSAAIDTWTLDASGTRLGHFNNDVVGTYIGEGSPIVIDSGRNGGGLKKAYCINALAAGQGITASEVELSRAAASGSVLRIGNMFDYAPTAIGKTTGAGFVLNITTLVNVDGELQAFEAYQYDNV